MSDTTVSETTRKCAHDMCKCQVTSGDRYCSTYCKDAAEIEEVEIECACEHPPCALD
jgi:hypothetical protein